MKRWINGVACLAVSLGMAAGCSQKCFLDEKVYRDAHVLPAGLEDNSPEALVQASTTMIPAPPTVDIPDRPARYLSLQEAVAIGLENGAASSRNGGVNTPGVVDDSPAIPTGGSLNAQSDRIRVLALQPAISAASMEASLARFDTLWATGINWSSTDEFSQGLQNFNNGSKASFSSTLMKLLSGGGVGSISFATDYTLLQNPPTGNIAVVNPNYTTRLTFGFEQPLLRNAGTEINQLLTRAGQLTGSTIPSAAAQVFNTQQGNLQSVAGQPVEGILISRLRFDQQRAEFERQMQNLLLNVEVAYWKLYQAYGQLYSNEEVLRILHKTWMVNYYQVQTGKLPPDNLYQIRGQYEEFRGERMNSLGAVLEAERNLRGILGMPTEDGTRLVPVTPPTLAPFDPNWDAALADALTLRPELVLARENLRFHQLALIREKNFLQPDLRFVGQYSPIGTGTKLYGDGVIFEGTGAARPANALESLSSAHFNDWSVGLTLAVPLGFRQEYASVRSARLQLAQAFYVLKDQEDRVKRTVAQQYQELTKWYRLIETRRAERRAYAESVQTRFKLLEVGTKVANLDLLDAQRRLALALGKEYQAIAEYNNTLARLEFAKGTIMQHDNVYIAEGGMGPCAQVRAVEHERERTRAFVLREKPTPVSPVNPIVQPGMSAADNSLPAMLDPNKSPTGPAVTPPPAVVPEPKALDKLPDLSGTPGFQGNVQPAAAQTPLIDSPVMNPSLMDRPTMSPTALPNGLQPTGDFPFPGMPTSETPMPTTPMPNMPMPNMLPTADQVPMVPVAPMELPSNFPAPTVPVEAAPSSSPVPTSMPAPSPTLPINPASSGSVPSLPPESSVPTNAAPPLPAQNGTLLRATTISAPPLPTR